jgi:hypothetical protein
MAQFNNYSAPMLTIALHNFIVNQHPHLGDPINYEPTERYTTGYTILSNAFTYILINEMILGAINENNDSINQLIDIHPELNNIIQIIYGNYIGRYILLRYLAL